MRPRSIILAFRRRRLTPRHLLFLFSLLLTPYSVFLTPSPANAQVNISAVYPLASDRTLGDYVSPLLKASLVGAGLIAFLLAVGGGIGMIAAAGNTKQQEKGRTAVTAGATGLLLVVGAYWILEILKIFTGIDLLNPGI